MSAAGYWQRVFKRVFGRASTFSSLIGFKDFWLCKWINEIDRTQTIFETSACKNLIGTKLVLDYSYLEALSVLAETNAVKRAEKK